MRKVRLLVDTTTSRKDNSELKDYICHNPKSSGYGIATDVNDYCGFWSWDK